MNIKSYYWKARAKIKVVDFVIISSICLVYRWIEQVGSTKPLMNKFQLVSNNQGENGEWTFSDEEMGGTFAWRYYMPTKTNSKTCYWGLNLPSKTCPVLIYNILWNSRPVVHYTVGKTYWHNVTSLPDLDVATMETTHKVWWSINPPSKTTTPLFRQNPLKSANCLSPHF